MNSLKRRIIAATLSMALIGAQALPVGADTADDIAAVQAQQEQTNAALYDVQSSIDSLEGQKQEILDQIDGYDQQLVLTMASIQSLDQQVAQKEKDLEKTAKDLKKAQKDEKVQYEAMKKRIQYLYEQGGRNGWVDVMMGDVSLSEGMDKVDNTQSMYKYDREELENYTKTAEEVKKLQAQQTQQKSSLEAMKQEQEGAKANLEALKEQAQAENENYDQQIAQAQATANEYYALIEQQNAQIAQLQEQKAAEDEAARQAAEAEAARQAAEQEAAQNVQTSGETYTGNDGDAQSDAGYSEDTSSYSESTGSSEAQTTVSAPVSAPASNGTGVSGSAVASYACQFTGNPYVWGGTSLTNGADCSGFVQSVYRQFGINLSRTTYTQANEGVAVSYNDMQPGDVINYGFHTAIYIGNNQIVHAADESLGIIVQSNPAYQPIVTIRRFV